MSLTGSFDDPDRCRSASCEYEFPHKHGWASAPNGNGAPAIISLVEDPRAEVRDPDTGEVIFPATKGQLRVIEGGERGTEMSETIWHRDGKRWTPPTGWQAIYDAITEYAGQGDHLYTEVERVLATHGIGLADAICAAINPPDCTHPACPLKAGGCATAGGRTAPFTDCPPQGAA